jgi:hypothetical protein
MLSGMPLVIFLTLFSIFLVLLPIWGAFKEEHRSAEMAAGNITKVA